MPSPRLVPFHRCADVAGLQPLAWATLYSLLHVLLMEMQRAPQVVIPPPYGLNECQLVPSGDPRALERVKLVVRPQNCCTVMRCVMLHKSFVKSLGQQEDVRRHDSCRSCS